MFVNSGGVSALGTAEQSLPICFSSPTPLIPSTSMRPCRLAACLLLALFLTALGGEASEAVAQEIRVDAGGGWGVPLSSVEMEASTDAGEEQQIPVDLGPGTHVYGAAGFVRSVSDNLALGVRGRAQIVRASGRASELTAVLAPCVQGGDCSVSNPPDGQLRAATLEGRLFLTIIDWIDPYFLVGLGIVQTHVEEVQIQTPNAEVLFAEVQVMDAGGDVGFGASLPLIGELSVETEIRVTGSLPGGQDSTLSLMPLSVGLSYGFGRR